MIRALLGADDGEGVNVTGQGAALPTRISFISQSLEDFIPLAIISADLIQVSIMSSERVTSPG